MKIFYDKFTDEVTKFREGVYTADLNMPVSNMSLSYHELHELLRDKDSEIFETAWKFSNAKWEQTNIDMVTIFDDIGISCGAMYPESNSYRCAYLTYTKKFARNNNHSLLFRNNGFIYYQLLRAISLGANSAFISIYGHSRKMLASIKRVWKKKVTSLDSDIYFYQDFIYEGETIIETVPQHVVRLRFDDLYIKYKDLILESKDPLYERSNVTGKYLTSPEKYPDVIRLSVPVDLAKMKSDFNHFSASAISHEYLTDRRDTLILGPYLNSVLIHYMGFRSQIYSGISLNKTGSTELDEHCGAYTSDFLKQFPTANRVNYITTKHGWKTIPHVDHLDYTVQGFRIIVPFEEFKMTFIRDTVSNEYIFEPGYAYFVNVCITHVGEHFSKLDSRAGLLFKICDDSIIWESLNG